jgi:hypothetical protein
MFDRIDQKYFDRRARHARARAETAQEPSIARIHRTFAEEYERKASEITVPRKAS